MNDIVSVEIIKTNMYMNKRIMCGITVYISGVVNRCIFAAKPKEIE